MGFRFQRRIKIAPGVRLNISKSGVSTSVGPRGATMTVGKRGVRANVGIPGTGLSYSEQLVRRSSARRTNEISHTYISTDLAEVDAYNAYVNMLVSVHNEVSDGLDWEKASHAAVTDDADVREVQRELADFKPTWLDQLFNRADGKRQVLQEKLKAAEKKSRESMLAEKELQRLANEVLAGNQETWIQAIQHYRPFEAVEALGNDVRVQIKDGGLVVYLQIIDEEIVPSEVLSLTAKGNLSRKKIAKTAYFALYQDYVCSCVIRIAREVFALLPADSVLIHVYGTSQADEPPINGCLLSTRVQRQELSGIFFDMMDCSNTIEGFEHRMNHLKTKGFRLVEELG